ncbi:MULTISPECIES: hypothetical protein [unclassified Chitinophaga]|uniref:hypothetical protein n=1 Tax=unclassified Chitinophaga TaxID=2619133 RepID=UPI0009C9B8EC|nr:MULTISPECIES: hypothetical protein [unclassified Chitinophaga]OMP81226.1 hypothetical protein BW716_01210 [[Flexibacter] sp. ATCC 35208]WPV67485.1 hypothetical protein QQL36_01935 [Chitinophaga sp. LS1]
MKRNVGYIIIIIFLGIFLVMSYSRQQQRVKKILAENERLNNENRHLRQSLDMSSNTAQQIADRAEVRERQNSQGQFVDPRIYYRKNWKQFIAVTNSDYRTGFLGGIKDLDVIVKNQTEFVVDNVVVSVDYQRGNGDVFKTEQYTISDIGAKGTKSVRAADSRKGQKVVIKLVSITSQSMNFCWAVNKVVDPVNPDPFKCTQDK